MSVLTPRADFSADDAFLDAVLGLLSGARRIDDALPPAEAPPSAAEPMAGPLLDALLGIVSLRARLTDMVTAWAVEPSPAPERAPADASVEDLLR